MIDSHDILEGVFEPLERINLMLFTDGEEGIDHGGTLRSYSQALY